MSDAALNHGFVPEEHAPEPVISHGDPTPPGKVGIWMFLASEIMFFIAILGTYIILALARRNCSRNSRWCSQAAWRGQHAGADSVALSPWRWRSTHHKREPRQNHPLPGSLHFCAPARSW